MDFDVEMKVIHCNNPEENPLPHWLRGEKTAETAGVESAAPAVPAPVFPSFCRPLGDYKASGCCRDCLDCRRFQA